MIGAMKRLSRLRSWHPRAGAAAVAACCVVAGGTALAGQAPAKIYTKAQAQAGRHVYKTQCESCHGSNLQGISGPPIGGDAFLKKAKLLGWSVENMRHVIVNQMPADNPGSLSPKQYAEVEAYVMARNCYPAGNTKFPQKSTKMLKTTRLVPQSGVAGETAKRGTCPLGGGQ
jgi:mono/diheme cytochrome c family protein